jgi:hypothetical protein
MEYMRLLTFILVLALYLTGVTLGLYLLRRLWLIFRQARRVGAFARARRAGLSERDARIYSDNLYPPTRADLEYERRCITKQIKRHVRGKERELDKLTDLTEDQRRQILKEFVEDEIRKYGIKFS